MQGLEMTSFDGLQVVDDGLVDQITFSDDYLSLLSFLFGFLKGNQSKYWVQAVDRQPHLVT